MSTVFSKFFERIFGAILEGEFSPKTMGLPSPIQTCGRAQRPSPTMVYQSFVVNGSACSAWHVVAVEAGLDPTVTLEGYERL